MAEDYYKTLGVSRTATPEEIAKAYRKLARKYHPDLNPDDKTAKTRFQEIQTAYDTLNDPDKRKLYNEYGSDYERVQAAGGANPFQGRSPFGNGGGGQQFDFNDVFGGGGVDIGICFVSLPVELPQEQAAAEDELGQTNLLLEMPTSKQKSLCHSTLRFWVAKRKFPWIAVASQNRFESKCRPELKRAKKFGYVGKGILLADVRATCCC